MNDHWPVTASVETQGINKWQQPFRSVILIHAWINLYWAVYLNSLMENANMYSTDTLKYLPSKCSEIKRPRLRRNATIYPLKKLQDITPYFVDCSEGGWIVRQCWNKVSTVESQVISSNWKSFQNVSSHESNKANGRYDSNDVEQSGIFRFRINFFKSPNIFSLCLSIMSRCRWVFLEMHNCRIQQACTGFIKPSHKIIWDQRTGKQYWALQMTFCNKADWFNMTFQSPRKRLTKHSHPHTVSRAARAKIVTLGAIPFLNY